MMRFVWAVLVLITMFFVPFAATPAHAGSSSQADSPPTAHLIHLINARRAASGLQPLTVNALLTAEAQRFSEVQAWLGFLTHRGADNTDAGQRLTGMGYGWVYWGENLAAGHMTPEAVVEAWLASPVHRKVVLSPNATEIGVGHKFRPGDPARYYDYWVLEIGRPT